MIEKRKKQRYWRIFFGPVSAASSLKLLQKGLCSLMLLPGIADLLNLPGENTFYSRAIAGNTMLAMSDQVRASCQEAERLIQAKKFKEALSILRKAEASDPLCAEVHGYLGMAYQNSLDHAKAIEEYQKALELSPQMSFLNVNIGTAYMNMGQPQLAVPYLQRYLQENPQAKDAAQVKEYIRQAGSNSNQKSLRTLIEAGQRCLSQSQHQKACSYFQEAIKADQNFAPAHFFLAFALAQCGQHENAILEFQEALRLDPGMKEAVLNIGSNYQSLGDCEKAIIWYQRFLKENPGSPKSGEIGQRISALEQQLAQTRKSQLMPPLRSATQEPGLNSAQASSGSDYYFEALGGGRAFRWQKMPVKVFIEAGGTVPGFRPEYTQLLMDAFSLWSRASEDRLLFQLQAQKHDADIVCQWTADANMIVEPGRSVEGGLTKLHALELPDGNAGIQKANVLILTHRNGNSLSDDDMKKVCLHEVGHALGINGHSSNNRDIMFFSESASIWPALTKRDKATICRLYFDYPKQGGSN